MKILLISLYNDEAYGMRQLHANLVHNGYETYMLFLKLNFKTVNSNEVNKITDEEMVLFTQLVEKIHPDLVGVSLVSSNFNSYKKLYEKIKDRKVVVGGWQASLNPEETIKYADYVCVGEGEDTIVQLADCLKRQAVPFDIPNTWVKRPHMVIKNKVRPLIRDFSQYPSLIFDSKYCYYIENNSLVNKEPYLENNRYGTMLGRGCPFHCTYCSNSYMVKEVYGKEWSKIRYRSFEHLLSELRIVKRDLPNIQRINFYDEVFVPREPGAFKQYKYEIGLPFYCMFYPGTCSNETAKELKEAGLEGVWLGIQSGSERVRREIFKRFYSNDIVRKQAEIFKKNDISVRYDFIFDNPFETEAEFEESVQLMKELVGPFSVNLFSLRYFPNTEITKMALEEGIVTEQDLDDKTKEDHHFITVNQIKKDEIKQKVNRQDVLFT